MRRALALLTLLIVLNACTRARAPRPGEPAPPELLKLQQTMAGSYDSKLQATTKDDYYEVDLHMQPIWTDRFPGRYLYVEQALSSTPDEPYRQRVYELSRRGRDLISKVYEIPQPERFVGAYANTNRLDVLQQDDLIEREGCAVYLKLDEGGIYRGQTKKDKCKSSLRGATYATSRVSIAGDFVQSWDQGFDAEGKQVWGATEGGYMFLKKE